MGRDVYFLKWVQRRNDRKHVVLCVCGSHGISTPWSHKGLANKHGLHRMLLERRQSAEKDKEHAGE